MARRELTSIHCGCGALILLCEDERTATALRAAIQTDPFGPVWPRLQAICESHDLGSCASCGQLLSKGRRLRRAIPCSKRAAA